MELDLDYFKKELEEEVGRLEDELRSLGAQKKPGSETDWEALPEEVPQMTADKNEMADRLEDFEQIRSTETSIEIRLNNVQKALEKIKNGTYGTCEIDGEAIPRERLKANPAAITCIEHAR